MEVISYLWVCWIQEDWTGDSLKPYKNDLDYLDDHIQVRVGDDDDDDHGDDDDDDDDDMICIFIQGKHSV